MNNNRKIYFYINTLLSILIMVVIFLFSTENGNSSKYTVSSTPSAFSYVTLYNSKGSYTISKNTYTKTPNALAAIAIVVIDYYNAMYGNAGIVCDAEVTPAGNFTGTIKVLY